MYVNLNTRCEVQYKVVTQDSTYGNNVETWKRKAFIWAELQDVLPSRDESITNQINVTTNRTRVRMRYRSDIDSTMRFQARGYTYQFVAGPAILGRYAYMEFMAERYTT